MARAVITVLFLHQMCSAQAAGNSEPLFLSVKLGEPATIRCSSGESSNTEVRMWYKQRLEHSPLEVASKLGTREAVMSSQFSHSRFKINKAGNTLTLTIENVSKKDEGMYFCGAGEAKTLTFSNSTFLAVTGDIKISVDQTPVLESVSSGESVTLQCTVLSEISPEDLRVLWFRSAAGRSFPEIIYTDHNSSSSRQCETSSSPHSCVYNFSKSILNDSDAGTYYCAVSTCGKIIIGNGTTVCLIKSDVPLLSLGVFSGVCLVVICVQAIVIFKMRRTGEKHQEAAVNERPPNQDHNADNLNYAPIRIVDKKTGRERKKEQPEELVYSQVRTSHANAHRSKR